MKNKTLPKKPVMHFKNTEWTIPRQPYIDGTYEPLPPNLGTYCGRVSNTTTDKEHEATCKDCIFLIWRRDTQRSAFNTDKVSK